MSNLLEYKGYCGTVEYSDEDAVLFGKVLGIRGLLSYEGTTVQELREDFRASIDEYLEQCQEDGVEPQKPYKGSFNVRISPELHRNLAVYAINHHQTLNSAVEAAIREYVSAS